MNIRFKITELGLNNMKEELENLKNIIRPSISEKIGEAIDQGDLKENADYHAAKEMQADVENQIAKLEKKISLADVVDITKNDTDFIHFGSTVKVIDLDNYQNKTYQLLSEYEADKDRGIISVDSPVGKALIGKKVGDEIEINIPAGIRSYEILEIL